MLYSFWKTFRNADVRNHSSNPPLMAGGSKVLCIAITPIWHESLGAIWGGPNTLARNDDIHCYPT